MEPRNSFNNNGLTNANSNQVVETIRFNVGGQKYEVSKSLLDVHSETMLATISSKKWHDKNTTSEIFMERDGTLFGYVLKYLRDGSVSLPITVSRNEIVSELLYYGISDVTMEAIDDSETQSFLAVKYFNKGGQVLKSTLDKTRKEASDLFTRRCCLLVASDCIETYMQKADHMETWSFTQTEILESSSEKYLGQVYDTKETSIAICNECLCKVGLSLSNIIRSSRYIVSDSSSIYVPASGCDSSSFGRGYSYEITIRVIQHK